MLSSKRKEGITMKLFQKTTGKLYLLLTALFAFLVITGLTASPVKAAAINHTDYEGKGKIEVNFDTKVTYKDLKVTVKNASGKKMKVKIVEKDNDDLEFKIKNYKAGTKYTYTIQGVYTRGESTAKKLTGKIKIPKADGGLPLKEIEYDAQDKEVEIEFDCRVDWKNPKVTITRGSKDYVRTIEDKDKDGIEVNVKKLKSGKVYHYTITGISKKGSGKWTTVSGTFRA